MLQPTRTMYVPPVRRWRALVVACVVLIVAAGCGDDEPEPLTVAEYAARGNAICNELAQSLEELEAELGANPSPAQQAEFAERAAAIGAEGIPQLLDLVPPASLKQQHDLLRERLITFDDTQQAFAAGDASNVELAQAAEQFDAILTGLWPSCDL